MQNESHRRLRAGLMASVVLAASLMAAPVHALPAGKEVRNIPAANTLTDWRALDKRHLLLQFTPERRYRVRLSTTCVNLTWADQLGISRSNNTIWAGFDYVLADGRQCSIERIEQL